MQLPEFVVCDVTGEAEFPDEEILLEERHRGSQDERKEEVDVKRVSGTAQFPGCNDHLFIYLFHIFTQGKPNQLTLVSIGALHWLRTK